MFRQLLYLDILLATYNVHLPDILFKMYVLQSEIHISEPKYRARLTLEVGIWNPLGIGTKKGGRGFDPR